MKTKIYLLYIVISLLSFLCGCSQQQIYTMTEKTVDEFVTDQSVKDKMIVQYTSKYSDEGIEFTHSQAIELYSILNISSCKEIIINEDFDYENLKLIFLICGFILIKPQWECLQFMKMI